MNYTDRDNKKMKNKNYALLTLLGSAAIAGVYSYIKGKGVFNKHRFAKQHEAIERYISTVYPEAKHSPIEAVGTGWCSVVTRSDGNRVVIFMDLDNNGDYIFKEKQM